MINSFFKLRRLLPFGLGGQAAVLYNTAKSSALTASQKSSRRWSESFPVNCKG